MRSGVLRLPRDHLTVNGFRCGNLPSLMRLPSLVQSGLQSSHGGDCNPEKPPRVSSGIRLPLGWRIGLLVVAVWARGENGGWVELWKRTRRRSIDEHAEADEYRLAAATDFDVPV